MVSYSNSSRIFKGFEYCNADCTVCRLLFILRFVVIRSLKNQAVEETFRGRDFLKQVEKNEVRLHFLSK